jgi:deoxyribodipyrimidine photolyase-like uncharacterized protein
MPFSASADPSRRCLYWRFIDRHREFFAGNPRMSVMMAQCDRMGARLDEHRRTAKHFLIRSDCQACSMKNMS